MERNEYGTIKVNPANMEQLCNMFARVWAEGVRPVTVQMHNYTEYVSMQVNDREQLATLARMVGKSKKQYEGDLFYLYGEIAGVPFRAYTNRGTVCRVVGEKEITEPAQPALPERTVKRPVWQCDEPLLADEPRTNEVSHGVRQAEQAEKGAA